MVTSSNIPEIAGFEVLECLGAGGLASVYRARQLYLDREVALKILPPEFDNDATTLDQFRSECRTAATLKHPHIVQIYEAGQDRDRHYLVMELIRGYTVGAWLDRKRRLDMEDALVIAEYVAQALRYAWQTAQVVHGDLKPDNIMVDEEGAIKVADFLALPRRGFELPSSLSRALIGTPNYMSPEQILGEQKLDCRSDIYSLGAVLYHVLSGRVPFSECRDEEAVLQGHLSGTLPDILDLNPTLPVNLAGLIEKMLTKDPDGRQPDWDTVLADLSRVRAGQMPLPPWPGPHASTMQRNPAHTRPTPTPTRSPAVVFTPPPAPLPPAPVPNRPRDPLVLLERLVYGLLAVGLLSMIYIIFSREQRRDRLDPLTEPVVSTPAPAVVPPAPDAPIPPSPPPEPELSEPAEDEYPLAYPEPHTAPVFTPQPAAQETPAPDPRRDPAEELEALRTYCQLIEGIVACSARRQYDQAHNLIQRWLETTPTAHTYRARARIEPERLQRVLGLFDQLRMEAAQLRGRSIRARTNIEGQIDDIRPGRIILSRTSPTGAKATFEVDWLAIYDRDMQALLQVVAPQPHSALAIWALSKGQIQTAAALLDSAPESARDPMVRDWIKDWGFAARNAQADQAVNLIAALVAEDALGAAQTEMDRATEAFGETLLFTRLRRAELEALAAAIQEGAPPASAPPQTTADESLDEEDLEEDVGFAPPPPGAVQQNPAAQQALLNMDFSVPVSVPFDTPVLNATPRDIEDQLREWHGQLVRLRFTGRSDLQRLEAQPGYAEVVLWDQRGGIRCLFPALGMSWIRDIRPYRADRRRSVYGVVDAHRGVVRLIGRTQKTQMGNQPTLYSW